MAQDYLVTAISGSRSQRLVWQTNKSLRIDEYTSWVLKKTEKGIFISGYDDEPFQLDPSQFNADTVISLPSVDTKFGERQLDLKILPLKTIAPVYVTPCKSEFDSNQLRPNQLFIFRGIGNCPVSYTPAGNRYRAYVERWPVFAYVRDKRGCRIYSYQEGVVFKAPDTEPVELKVREPFAISDLALTEGKVEWNEHWWRVTRIPIPESIPLRVLFEEDLKESLWYRRISRIVAISFLAVSFCAILYPKLLLRPVPIKPPVQVALKTPKEIPKSFEMPKPIEPPKPIVAEPPPPPPKPEKKAPEPPPKPKVEAKPAPAQPKPRPEKKVELPPSGPAAAPAPAPTQPKGPTQSEQAQAELAKSLNFLSPSVNKPKALVNTTSQNRNFQNVGSAVLDQRPTSILKDLSQSTGSSGPIDTKSARNINGTVNVAGSGKGKSLNQVMGRVSLNSLYSASGGGEIGNSISGAGTGMALSGEGKLAESLIQKVLAKHLDKFQYCYEKSLLTDSSLAGNVVMQWTISTSGSASDIKVVRSQINNSSLHNCLSLELSRIRFPSPSGGSVTVKYPFAFSSSSL